MPGRHCPQAAARRLWVAVRSSRCGTSGRRRTRRRRAWRTCRSTSRCRPRFVGPHPRRPVRCPRLPARPTWASAARRAVRHRRVRVRWRKRVWPARSCPAPVLSRDQARGARSVPRLRQGPARQPARRRAGPRRPHVAKLRDAGRRRGPTRGSAGTAAPAPRGPEDDPLDTIRGRLRHGLKHLSECRTARSAPACSWVTRRARRARLVLTRNCSSCAAAARPPCTGCWRSCLSGSPEPTPSPRHEAEAQATYEWYREAPRDL
jgi:hypothetical protein